VSTQSLDTALTDVLPADVSARRERLRALSRSKTFRIGIAVMLFWILCALIGGHLVPHDPYKDDILDSLQPPSADHLFGTDRLGRDVFSRVIVGSRDILLIAPLATLLGTILGTILGLVTGYFRGWVDDVTGRFIDALLALPLQIVALMALVALGPSTRTVIIVIGVVFMPVVARTVRSAVLAERELEYVAAAHLRTERELFIMGAEILPNVMPPIVVETTVRVGYAIFAVATLSFIGFGVQPPSPDWGLQISESYSLITGGFWWTALFPALAIVSLVVAVNLISDAVEGVIGR
jgi:peptide/nickel transport system permease protein